MKCLSVLLLSMVLASVSHAAPVETMLRASIGGAAAQLLLADSDLMGRDAEKNPAQAVVWAV